ncbi:hypothetical protein R80B4_00463 [Fibrobacteres bacterium R8-0-B4]
MRDAIRMMESKMTPESVARTRLMAEQEIVAIRRGHGCENSGEKPKIVKTAMQEGRQKQ